MCAANTNTKWQIAELIIFLSVLRWNISILTRFLNSTYLLNSKCTYLKQRKMFSDHWNLYSRSARIEKLQYEKPNEMMEKKRVVYEKKSQNGHVMLSFQPQRAAIARQWRLLINEDENGSDAIFFRTLFSLSFSFSYLRWTSGALSSFDII